jgi:hypothetical protein
MGASLPAPSDSRVALGDQPAQQRLGGPDDQLAVVDDDDVVAALVVGPLVAEVVGD